MGVAGRRAGAEAVRLQRGSVRRGPAPRDRHRSSHGLGGPFRRRWGRRVCRATASTGSLPDCPNRGRLVRDARPAGLDRSARRNSGQRGRRRRHGRSERGARGDGAVCPSGHPLHGGSQRLCRSAGASASQAGTGSGATRSADVTGAASGSAGWGACRRSVTLGPAAPPSGRGKSTCPGTIRCCAAARDSACACESDAEAAVPLSAGSACPAHAVPSASRSCAELARPTFGGARGDEHGNRRSVSLTCPRMAPRRHLRGRSWTPGPVARRGSC